MTLVIICIIALFIVIIYGIFRIAQIVRRDNIKFDVEINDNSAIRFFYDDWCKKNQEAANNNWWHSYTETRYEFEMPKYDHGKAAFKKAKKKSNTKPLEEQLKEAVDCEDYETAARIRDEIKSRN